MCCDAGGTDGDVNVGGGDDIMVTIVLMTVRTIAGEGVIRVTAVMTVIMVSIMVVVVAVMW